MLFGNEAMHEICQKHLDIRRPSNRLIAKAVSAMTAPLRFESELNVDMDESQANLVLRVSKQDQKLRTRLIERAKQQMPGQPRLTTPSEMAKCLSA